MRFLFFMGHPAHYHLFRVVIGNLQRRGHQTHAIIKSKDVLEPLVRSSGLVATNIHPRYKSTSPARRLIELVSREWRSFDVARAFKADVLIGSMPEAAHVGWLLRKPSLVFSEDDWHVVPSFARTTYPFARYAVAPECCDMGPWANKTLSYPGYHELAYLHPNHFTPDPAKVEMLRDGKLPQYFLLRFAKLNAYHDAGRGGVEGEVARRIIALLQPFGQVYISAERELERDLEQYRLPTAPEDIHHVLAYAGMYIGDSQTMAAEAAVLGTPSLRFNDFVGQIGYLEDLQRLGLTVGIRRSEPDSLLNQIQEWLATPDLKAEWARRRSRMLAKRIDTAAFITWLVENLPGSADELKRKPDIVRQFATATAPGSEQ